MKGSNLLHVKKIQYTCYGHLTSNMLSATGRAYSVFTNLTESFSLNSSKATEHMVLKLCRKPHVAMTYSYEGICEKPVRKISEHTVHHATPN